MPILKKFNKAFFKTWSPEMAYVLGFFAADGAMIENNRGAHFVEFHSTDRILISTIQRIIGSNHQIGSRKEEAPRKTAYRLQIGSKEWFGDLSLLGFTQNKSLTLRFPPVPDKYFGDFIRGYFDGDGCVYFSKLKYADRPKKRWILMILFTSGSRLFLEVLWKELKKRGVKGGSLQKKNRGFDLKFSHRDSIALYGIMYNNSHARLFLPRKQQKLKRALQFLGFDKPLRE